MGSTFILRTKSAWHLHLIQVGILSLSAMMLSVHRWESFLTSRIWNIPPLPGEPVVIPVFRLGVPPQYWRKSSTWKLLLWSFWEQHPVGRKSLAPCQQLLAWLTYRFFCYQGKKSQVRNKLWYQEIHLLPLKINVARGSCSSAGASEIMIWCPREQHLSYSCALIPKDWRFSQHIEHAPSENGCFSGY